jgi:hypothetical protein
LKDTQKLTGKKSGQIQKGDLWDNKEWWRVCHKTLLKILMDHLIGDVNFITELKCGSVSR